MAAGREVPFHEYGRKFTWSPASRKVYILGHEVAKDCFNLEQARDAARKFVTGDR